MPLLSGHCNIKNPDTWGYCYLESISSFAELCDEVVVVDGGSTDQSLEKIRALPYKNIRIEHFDWADKWEWSQLGRSMNYGFEKCQGDFRMRFDADYVFHEKGIKKLRDLLKNFQAKGQSVLAVKCNKININLYDLAVIKSSLPLIVNAKDYEDLGYGIAEGDKDFMYAIRKKEFKNGNWYGESIINYDDQLYPSFQEVWCYDDTFMTYEQVSERKKKFALANQRFYFEKFNEQQVADKATNEYLTYIENRLRKYWYRRLKLADHPKVMEDKIKEINNKILGWDLFGRMKRSDMAITDIGVIKEAK
jgi:glycosyltransferase involved in cell wall biosynthesis